MLLMTFSRGQVEHAALGAVNVAVPVFVLWHRYSGEVSSAAAVLIAAISLVTMNSLLVVGFRSEQRRLGIPPSPGMPAKAAVLSLFALLLTAAGAKAIPVRNEYLGLALSDKPLSEIQPERKRLVVELGRKRAANSREYDRTLAEAKSHPLSPALYSPESFASVDVINETAKKLQKYFDVDMDYGGKQQQVMSEFRNKMANVDPDYLNRWDSERRDAEQREASTMELEKQWFAGVVAVYAFAAAHHDQIKGYDSSAEPAGKTAQDFKQQVARSEALQKQLQEQVQQLVKRQNDARDHMVAYVP
jgi:hypothetical protein